MKQASAMLREAFMESDPSCRFFFLENVEMLLAANPNDSNHHHLIGLRCLLEELFEELSRGSRFVAIMATSSRPDDIVSNNGFFAQKHRIAFSTPEQRLAVLRIILKPLLIEDLLTDDDVVSIAKRTHGFSIADLEKLKFEAFAVASRRNVEVATAADFDAALQSGVCRPSLMAEYWQRLPSQQLDELVGLDSIIARLQDMILLPFQQAELCSRFRIGLPRGILIHGPTGVGKTHLALGLIRQAGLNYIPISAPTIRSKYVGEGEKRLAAVFQRARECAPSVLLIDHIDGLVSRRDASSSSCASDRLITCFLTEMDGIAAKGNASNIVVIGITDAIHKLDPAMIRPGRLGIHICLPTTLSRQDRRKLLLEVTKIPLSLTQAEIDTILNRSEGYSGAMMKSLLEDAALDALSLDAEIVTFANFFKR